MCGVLVLVFTDMILKWAFTLKIAQKLKQNLRGNSALVVLDLQMFPDPKEFDLMGHRACNVKNQFFKICFLKLVTSLSIW